MRQDGLLMGIDTGTTSAKVIAMSPAGDVCASASVHYSTTSPHPGWVEQEPEVWWNAVVEAIRECLRHVDARSIQGISFSGHMSAPVLLGVDGTSVMPSILIADMRSSEETRFLRMHYMNRMLNLTGNEPLDAFTASKLLWIKNFRPEALQQASVILFPKDYIRYKLSDRLGTDPTDAGNSLLFDREHLSWDMELIGELGLPERLFPPILLSDSVAGQVSMQAARLTGLAEGTPIITGGADMACSQLGTGAATKGKLAVTLSTSAQVVLRVNSTDDHGRGRVTYHPSAIPGTLYAMGTVFTGGLGMEWGYKLLTGKTRMEAEDYNALNALYQDDNQIPPGSGGLLFFPFLTGSGTPYFDSCDRASWLGLSTGQSPAWLLHSVMEGVAYNIRESMEVYQEAGYEINAVHLGGGGSRNSIWMRMIGDILGKDIVALENRDASAAGAAILAGVGAKIYKSAESAAASIVRTGVPYSFSPDRHATYNKLYGRYRKMYQALNEYYSEIAREPIS